MDTNMDLNTDLRKIYLDKKENLQFGDQQLNKITKDTIFSPNGGNSSTPKNKFKKNC